MSRILSIDYGTKRCGLAATDTLQIAVHGITTVPTVQLWLWLETYLRTEEVEKVVIGYPRHADGAPVYFDGEIKQLKKKLESAFPEKQIILHDESFTSAKAKEVILRSGIKKEKRKDKSLVDKISAVIILQDFLQHY